ncbi:TPA: hypothetical protein I8370_003586 [Klebsiella oxytoca]|nr:hypothetical protein [Klebsiella oxytoca]
MLNSSDIILKVQPIFPENTFLSNISQYSLNKSSNLTRNILANKEIKFIYQYALKQKTNNKIFEIGILARKNPQFQSAPTLQIEQTPETREYSEWFPERSSHFVKPGSVASMFSPADYLTEMHAQAQRLQGKDSIYHIDQRCPDLSGLVLSQESLDAEIPVLKLANNILLENTRTYLTLRFPNATGKQKRLLQTLVDVILDIRYTIAD